MRRAARTDDNQSAIQEALEAIGCTVQSLGAVGAGCPDLAVGYAGCNVLLEVKNRNGFAKGKNSEGNDGQKKWARWWKGQVAMVYTPEEAVEAVLQALARETGQREGVA